MAEGWSETREDRIVVATYAAPPMSYFTDAAIGELERMIDAWSRSDAAVIVLTGGVEGRFITHFDVDALLANQEAPDPIFEAPRRSRRVQAMLRRLDDLPQPVIAALNGDTMGFGYELALSADFRIAQRGDFRIGLPEVRLGISPGGSGLTRLTKLVGRSRALDLILRARVVPPEEACALGMVSELAEDALAAAMDLARELAAMPTLAVALAKKAIHQGADLPLDLALTLETEASFRVKQSPETMGAMRAYLDQPLERRRAYLEGEGEAHRS
jgi:enoyl-CoA hydratase